MSPGVLSDASSVVELDTGAIRGRRRRGTRQWRGIPYAAAPAGDLR
ncbi:hypothetical protein ESO86_14240, partial [Agromyces binzhouensis]